MKLLLAILLICSGCSFLRCGDGVCHADECQIIGNCKASPAIYKQVTFLVSKCDTAQATKELAERNKGIIVKEKDKDEYTVIWNPAIEAPETQYIECTQKYEED